MLLPQIQTQEVAQNISIVGKRSIPLILYAESKTAALTGAAVPLSFYISRPKGGNPLDRMICERGLKKIR